MADNFICKKCGKTLAKLYQNDLCYDCYGEEWSNGFEATSDWGASIAHKDMIGDLNEVMETEYDKSIKIIKELLDDFLPGAWTCAECGNVKIARDEQDNFSPVEILDKLKSVCCKCGKTNNFEREYRGAY